MVKKDRFCHQDFFLNLEYDQQTGLLTVVITPYHINKILTKVTIRPSDERRFHLVDSAQAVLDKRPIPPAEKWINNADCELVGELTPTNLEGIYNLTLTQTEYDDLNSGVPCAETEVYQFKLNRDELARIVALVSNTEETEEEVYS